MNRPSPHKSLPERVRHGDEVSRTGFYDRCRRIVRSEAIDFIRSNAARKQAEERFAEAGTGETTFDGAFMAEWRKAVLSEALEELPSRVEYYGQFSGNGTVS
ncbi:MAG: sigma-70 family RNA polymerase sigma factor [Lentisphaeria bacterium]|nr:sigma-70 family RNA polymerase sigma factor [Lentisphaeria bacterium]